MTFAGHSSIQMTMERYGHLFPSPDHQNAMAEVEAKLRDELVAWMRRTRDPILKSPIGSPYRQAALRALGLPAEPDPYA